MLCDRDHEVAELAYNNFIARMDEDCGVRLLNHGRSMDGGSGSKRWTPVNIGFQWLGRIVKDDIACA
jgi:hypothetical protein